MTAPLNSNIRIISYNCRGWNSASNFVSNLMDDCDICLIQEHWLFKEQLISVMSFHQLLLVVWLLQNLLLGGLMEAVPYSIVSRSLVLLKPLRRLLQDFVQFHLPAPQCRPS